MGGEHVEANLTQMACPRKSTRDSWQLIKRRQYRLLRQHPLIRRWSRILIDARLQQRSRCTGRLRAWPSKSSADVTSSNLTPSTNGRVTLPTSLRLRRLASAYSPFRQHGAQYDNRFSGAGQIPTKTPSRLDLDNLDLLMSCKYIWILIVKCVVALKLVLYDVKPLP